MQGLFLGHGLTSFIEWLAYQNFACNYESYNELFNFRGFPFWMVSLIDPWMASWCQFRIFNRWGQLIFQSNDPNKGWNVDLNSWDQNNDTFVWQCIYQIDGEKVNNTKSTVVLIR